MVLEMNFQFFQFFLDLTDTWGALGGHLSGTLRGT